MKTSKSLLVSLSVLVAALLLAALFLFIVREGQAVVLTTFGKPVKACTEAGLYGRWPWPVQTLYRYDNRVHTMTGTFEETMTRDGKIIVMMLFAGWRIADPIPFLERVGSEEKAEQVLDGLLRNYKNAVIGQYPFSALVNVDPEAMRLVEIEQRILEEVRPAARERYHVEVAFVGVKKISLPEAITESVFKRMRAERNELAEHHRSLGRSEATRIRAEADSRREEILARADAEAEALRARGDAEAADYYRAFEEDPELALFLRKLDVLERALTEDTTVFLSSEAEPFDLLEGPPAREGNHEEHETDERSGSNE